MRSNSVLAIVVFVGAVVFVIGGLVFGLNRKPVLRAGDQGADRRTIHKSRTG